MNILFLDTETSGLRYLEHEIIEIGGVVTQLDANTGHLEVVSTFTSLVKNTRDLDPKITRITGIDNLDLQTAPPKIEVQNSWADWLENSNIPIEAICGHSLSFDLGFLKHGGWYLPPTSVYIDTLELAKILLPDSKAVNLEFLIEWYRLKPETKLPAQILPENLIPHRALYDTLSTVLVCQYLLQRLHDYQPHKPFMNLFSRHFYPDTLTEYSRTNPRPESQETEKSEIHIDLQGNPIQPSLFEMVQCTNHEYQQNLIQLCEIPWNKSTAQIVCQLYILSIFESNRTNLKFHGRDSQDFRLAKLFIEYCRKNITNVPIQHREIFTYIESILTLYRTLSEDQMNLGSYIQMVEIYHDLRLTLEPEWDGKSFQKIINSYEFLQISLQPLWLRGEYNYKPHNSLPEDLQVQHRFAALLSLLSETPNEASSHPLLVFIQNKLTEFDGIHTLQSNRQYTFRNFHQNLTIHSNKPDFSLREHLRNLHISHPHLIYQTYLPESKAREYIQILTNDQQLSDSLKIQSLYTEHVIEQREYGPLADFVIEMSELSQAEKRPVVLLCGQNSTLKDLQKTLIDTLPPSQFMALGESGSLSKLTSKLMRATSGVFVAKVGDFLFISQSLPTLTVAQTWIIHEPYLYIHYRLRSLGEEKLSLLKSMTKQAMLTRIYSITQSPVGFLRNYHAR